MKNKFIIIIIAIFTLFGLYGCDGENIKEPIDQDIYIFLPKDRYNINTRTPVEIEYNIEGSNSLKVEYELSKEGIIEIIDGMIHPLANGEVDVIIYIKDDKEVNARIKVKVDLGEEGNALEVLNWAKNEIGVLITVPKLFPTKHPKHAATITYESSNTNILHHNGLPNPSEYDEEVKVKITVKLDNIIVSDEIIVLVTGTIPNQIANEILGDFGVVITRDYQIKDLSVKYPTAKVTFWTSNNEVFSKEGKFIKPLNDEVITLFVRVVIEDKNVDTTYTKNVTARGLTMVEKGEMIKETVLEYLKLEDGYYITDQIQLPTLDHRFNAKLTWESDNDKIFKKDTLTFPIMNTMLELKCVYTIGNEKSSFILELEVKGYENQDMWENINQFIEEFYFIEEIKTQAFRVTGVKEPYIGYNRGYIPFYNTLDNKITVDHLPLTNKNRPKTIMSNVEWIAIHDTANNGEGADALMHNSFIKGADVSWHYTVDDKMIINHLPDNEVGWHSGTTWGNNSSIGIETCVHIGVDYNLVMRKTAYLTAKLLLENDLTLYNVRQHNFFSGKDCPQTIRGANRWKELLNLVRLEYFAQKNLQDVEFIFESLSPQILDNSGRVINHPGVETMVNYKITVKYNNKTVEYTHSAKLLEMK